MKTKKIHVNLSLPEPTANDLAELSEQFGMTRSGLVNFLIKKAKINGTKIFQ